MVDPLIELHHEFPARISLRQVTGLTLESIPSETTSARTTSALDIPPQPGEGVRESGWRLGRGERLAKCVQGQGAIFSKYADTNDDVLLCAKVASPFVNR